jgi:cyclic pyranopterin monophosphate synthase
VIDKIRRAPCDPQRLTHLDEHGHARMVDITSKSVTQRVAIAKCVVATTTEAGALLKEPPDGIDPLEVARVAGVLGAKKTSSLIPLCHPLHLDDISLGIRVTGDRIEIAATCQVLDRTGVEMEALMACVVAGLSVVKVLMECDPNVSISDLTLWQKSGGRSGNWVRTSAESG